MRDAGNPRPQRSVAWPWDWRALPMHSALLASPARFKVLCAARRSGKSTLLRTELASRAAARPGQVCWYLATTHAQAREVGFAPFVSECPRGLVAEVLRGEMTVRFVNGSVVAFRGFDNADALRGRGLDAVALDEAQEATSEVWEGVVRPSLADRGGTAIIAGTPRGRSGLLYSLYEHAGASGDEWARWHMTAYSAGLLPREEVDRARAAAEAAGPMTATLWRREWMAAWDAFVGQVFAFDTVRHVVDDADVPDAFQQVAAGVDWGYSPEHPGAMVVAGQALDGRWYVLDEVVAALQPLSWWAEQLIRLRSRWGIRRTWCDPARPESLAELRRTARKGAVQPAVNDRFDGIYALGSALETGRLFVHRRCGRLLQEFPAYRWKVDHHGAALQDAVKVNDHALDATRYAIHSEMSAPKLWMA